MEGPAHSIQHEARSTHMVTLLVTNSETEIEMGNCEAEVRPHSGIPLGLAASTNKCDCHCWLKCPPCL